MRDRDYFRYRDSSQFSEERLKKFREERQRNRMFFGVGIAVVGILLLLRSMDILPYFTFSFSWPIALIIIGIFLALKRGPRSNAWWILILVGAANLTPQFMIMGKPSSHVVWPVLIILAGLAFAFRPSRNRCAPGQRRGRYMDTNISTESTLNIDVTFGGRKEVVTSKDFKGGVISATFGGCELNLTQADFTEPSVVIECHVSFGSVEIILPSHWEVQNEIAPSFGSVEDGRTIQTATTSENKKLLILRGNCSFGSVELKSY